MRNVRAVACSIAACIILSGASPPHSGAAKYLFVWTGDGDRKLSDFVVVLDADPASTGYGHIVASLVAGATGTGPHHTEPVFPADGMLLAEGWPGSRTFLFDLRKPTAPRLDTTFTSVGGYGFAHSFARLPGGHVLATFQGAGLAYAPPGGLVEMDERGTLIRSRSAAAAGLRDTLVWPYSLAVDAAHDRVITTNHVMPIPRWLVPPQGSWIKARADAVRTAEIQVWSLSALRPLITLALPPPPDTIAGTLAANIYPAEPLMLPDGSAYINTFSCGLYHLTGVATSAPQVALVHTFPTLPFVSGMACAVPAIIGHYWIQTVSALPGLVALDITDPARPREVSRLVLGDSFAMPHWMAADPGGNRVVVTGLTEGWVVIANVDPHSGALSLDRRFRDERTGSPSINLSGRSWPQGMITNALPHGAVFGPP